MRRPAVRGAGVVVPVTGPENINAISLTERLKIVYNVLIAGLCRIARLVQCDENPLSVSAIEVIFEPYILG